MADVRAVLVFVLTVAYSDAVTLSRKGSSTLLRIRYLNTKSGNIFEHHESPVTVLYDDDVVDSEYPEADAEKLLAELNRRNLTKFLLRNEVNKYDYKPVDFKYSNICKSETRKNFIPLQVRDDITNEIYWILNPSSQPIQYFNFEKCVQGSSGKNKQCHVEEPGGEYTTECQQEHIKRTVLFMKDRNTIATSTGTIPSCCTCYIQPTNNIIEDI